MFLTKLDMPDGSICCPMATRFISYRVLSEAKNISILRGKNIEQTKFAYRQKEKTMEQNKNQLREESIEFAIAISDVCDNIKGCSIYINQLLRSSSSIGANIHDAKYAQSRSDFIHKLEIALKESSETDYWLELIYRKNKFSEETYKELKNNCGIIRRKLIASITTAKKNKDNAGN